MPRNGNDNAARWRWIMMLCFLGSVLHAARTGCRASPCPPTAAQAAIEPAAPVVPAEVIAAIQGGEYETAPGARSLSETAPRTATMVPTSPIFKPSPSASSGQRDAARETLRKAIEANPDGPLGPQDPVRAGGHRAGRR